MKHRLIAASVVLAMSLVFGTEAAAAAEPLQLTCEPNEQLASNALGYQATIKVRIDFDNQTVTFLNSGGLPLASTTDRGWNALPPSVRISEGTIEWRLGNSNGSIFFGSLDRETGKIGATWYERGGTTKSFGGQCRRATQKF